MKRARKPAKAPAVRPPSKPGPSGKAAQAGQRAPAKRQKARRLKEVGPDVMPGIVAAVNRMAESSRQFRDKVAAHLRDSGAAAFVKCPESGPDHPLDLEATCRASWGAGTVTPVFARCERCRALDLTDADLWLHRAGAPKILLKASFENWEPRTVRDHSVLAACRSFGDHPRGFLVLQGAVGVGKTHLAVAILRAAERGRLITQTHFLLMLRETYRNDRAPNPVDLCCGASLLVFDELSAASGSKDEFPALQEVLNHRYSEGLPTVFTTNVPLEEFETAFGDRIADRLATSVFCGLKGESWRKQK